MIFPPESVHEFRRELAVKMASGALSDAEAFRQALAVDPHDPAATRFIALTAEKDGDRALAAQLAHRFIEAEPTSHEGYALLGRVLSDPPLAAAYLLLGIKKLRFDPEARERLGPIDLPDPPPVPAPRPWPPPICDGASRSSRSILSPWRAWAPSPCRPRPSCPLANPNPS